MTASTRTIHNHAWLSRLIVSLTIGLMTLALGAATAFAGTGTQATRSADNAAPVISTGGDQVTLNEDDEDDDECDDDDCEESGGGGGGALPATDTAPLIVGALTSADDDQVTLNEDDEDDDDDDDDDDEEGSSGGGGGLPATDAAPGVGTGSNPTPIPAIAVLVITGLVGGAVRVAAKRSI